MKRLNLAELARAVNCKSIEDADAELSFNSVSTDTRKIEKGDIFIALKGERFDAHDFLEEAVKRGAQALIVNRKIEKVLGVPQLVVGDTLEALQSLANYNRISFDVPLVGITGSNGKTTTKDMVAAVLGQKYQTLKTKGNFNNEIGLPLTLLELDETYQAAVLEMGMSGLGEIDLLGRIARPNIVIITNIGETHLEKLGSVENIALAKSEILNHLDDKGLAIFNGEDQLIQKVAANFQGKKLFYGFESKFDCWAEDINTVDNKGQSFIINLNGEKHEIFLPILGKHNILNAMAAVLVGTRLGLNIQDIKLGLESLKLTSMRLEIIERENFTVINDAYNASPVSMKASIKILKEMGSNTRTIAVLGDMYELGDRTEEGHREVGEAVAGEGIELLIGVGNLAKYIVEGAKAGGLSENRLFHVSNNQEARELLGKIGRKGDLVLLKGSRGMKMEEIIQGRF